MEIIDILLYYFGTIDKVINILLTIAVIAILFCYVVIVHIYEGKSMEVPRKKIDRTIKKPHKIESQKMLE